MGRERELLLNRQLEEDLRATYGEKIFVEQLRLMLHFPSQNALCAAIRGRKLSIQLFLTRHHKLADQYVRTSDVAAYLVSQRFKSKKRYGEGGIYEGVIRQARCIKTRHS